jgi:hypothetical protein
MTTFRRELPGDLLWALLHELGIKQITAFVRQHEQRIGRALEASARDVKGAELDRTWNVLVLNDQKWYNRFAIQWKSDPTKWRTVFTLQNLDALILAGWVEDGSEMHERFQSAIRLQDALKLGSSYDELAESYRFEEPIDFMRVYDTLSWVFADMLRAHPSAGTWPIDRIMGVATSFSRNALEALQKLGVITIPEGGLDGITDWGQTRGFANPGETPAAAPLKAIYDWAWLILSDEFPDDTALLSAP